MWGGTRFNRNGAMGIPRGFTRSIVFGLWPPRRKRDFALREASHPGAVFRGGNARYQEGHRFDQNERPARDE